MKVKSLSLLLLLSLLHPALSSPTNLYPVSEICKKTRYPSHCKSSVNSMVPDLTTTDPTTILQLLMKAADVNTGAALRHAKEISDDSETKQSEKSIVDTCIDLYDSASTSLEEAENALERHDKHKMKSYISAVITHANDCEDAYKTGKLVSPLTEYSTMNEHLAANSLKLIESFWPSKSPPPPPSSSKTTPQSVEIDEEYSGLADDYSELLAPSTSPSSSIGSSDKAKSVCDKAKYPDICLSSVQSVASGPLKSNDAATILQLMIKNTIFTTQAAIDRAKVFAKASETDQRTKDILDHNCVREYEHALNGLEEVTKAIASNDKETIKSELAGLKSQYSKCGDAFEDAQLDSPMGEYRNTLNKLAENNLAVATSFWS